MEMSLVNSKIILVILFLFFAGCTHVKDESTDSYLSLPEEFTFIPDEGIRVEEASNPGVHLNDDGSTSLYYYLKSSVEPGELPDDIPKLSISEDGLIFEEGEDTNDVFRAKQLPDGTWRDYGFDQSKNCLISRSSEDGKTFDRDEGCRYIIQEDDKGTVGIIDFFVDSQENIVLLYIGDMYGLNNVRRAYSTDNGWTFTFTNGNVLNDENLGGEEMSFVDQKVIVLEDGRVFLVSMRLGEEQIGTVYGFISEDDGVTFKQYKEVLLKPSDFNNYGYGIPKNLHDPVIVQLKDGRYRIYVGLSIKHEEGNTDQKAWAIVSATTEL